MRYLPLTDQDRQDMLAAIGAPNIEALYQDVAADVLLDQPVDLPGFKGELEVDQLISNLAAKNLGSGAAPFFLGAGNYSHHIPAAADHLIQRSEFLTSYTPYQPEVSQGTLQALFEFQTQVAMITGMEVANASLYDGATAAAEAAMMSCRVTRRNKVILSGGLHPHYAEVTATNAKFLSLDVVTNPANPESTEDLAAQIDDETACVIVQNPGFFGQVRDHATLAEACHDKGALLVVVVTEIVSLGAVLSPGEMGADIVAAEGQSLGNALNFGGPHVGLFAVREKYLRQMPGRLAGETEDVEGKRGWVLTLSTREQHIRREKATSNICTNSGLCALAFSIHLTLLGEAGFTRLAQLNHATAIALADKLDAISGVEVINETFFNEFTLRLSKPATAVVEALAARGILAGVPASRLYPDNAELENLLLVAATETVTPTDMDQLVGALEEVL
ncbi:MAG: aminomethyl-transferring glycine dehydrogenase subunit GcvPA [Rhodospirillaceae bacterium]|jgi:glycine dehydrogenase subunit 1|nr:aminomethyl-transferring glycine dehydrogenase subunit GcvPA [Rhodospirillaceae bacterium]MBT7953790.1 aminomethyl-transferring glycine dehydrogenase subunit GcvPA [Rhodospirillaceae bacterium]